MLLPKEFPSTTLKQIKPLKRAPKINPRKPDPKNSYKMERRLSKNLMRKRGKFQGFKTLRMIPNKRKRLRNNKCRKKYRQNKYPLSRMLID